MKPLNKHTAERMCHALIIALLQVKHQGHNGLCVGIVENGFLRPWEKEYLCRWIKGMLQGKCYLEALYPDVEDRWNAHARYLRRRPWVKWMINHLKATT